jgi:hypothetical protein
MGICYIHPLMANECDQVENNANNGSKSNKCPKVLDETSFLRDAASGRGRLIVNSIRARRYGKTHLCQDRERAEDKTQSSDDSASGDASDGCSAGRARCSGAGAGT